MPRTHRSIPISNNQTSKLKDNNEKLTSHMRKLLLDFSKNSVKHQKKEERNKTTWELMEETEELWNFGVSDQKSSKTWKVTHFKSVLADSGSPAFLPPDEICQALKSVEDIKLMEYASPRVDEELLSKAQNYFNEMGIIDKNKTRFRDQHYHQKQLKQKNNGNNTLAETVDYTMQIADGGSRLFQYAVTKIIRHPGDVMIVPTPNYGLFMGPIIEQGGKIIEIPLKHPQFKIDRKKLEKVISEQNAQFLLDYKLQIDWLQQEITTRTAMLSTNFVKNAMDILGCLQSETNNIINLDNIERLRTQFNTNIQNELSSRKVHKEMLSRMMLRPLNRVRGFLNVNPNMPLGSVLNQDEIDQLAQCLKKFKDLCIIDDVTYIDLIMPHYQFKPGTFAKSDCADQTITLYSMSKQFGLAAARVGFALGPNGLLQPMLKSGFNCCPSENIFARTIVDSLFSMKFHKVRKYLLEVNTEYAFRLDLCIALIQGKKSILNKENLPKIEQMLLEQGIEQSQLETLLKGIPKLKLLNYPDSGFAVVLNFENYKGVYLGNTQLNSSADFFSAFKSLIDVHTLPMEMCFEPKLIGLRYSFAEDTENVIEGLLRIRNLTECCSLKPLEKVAQSAIEILPPSQPLLSQFHNHKAKQKTRAQPVETASAQRKSTRERRPTLKKLES